MNANELKLLFDTLASIGEEASSAVIWWLVLHHGSSVLGWLIFAATLVILVVLVTRAIQASNEWMRLGREVSEAWGGNGGRCVFSSDTKALTAAIEAGKARGR